MKNDIMVYMSYPSLYDEQYEMWKNDISNLINKFNEELNIPIISEVDDYVFNSEEIFDTVYHLNGSGIKRRSETLVKDLNKVL